MPYIFECDICKRSGPNHAGTLQLVLYDWSKEPEEKTRDLITVCDECLPRIKEAIINFYQQLGVPDGRH